jgi:enamine deaminase RidA (YjgF/YER057c/UK114 family)
MKKEVINPPELYKHPAFNRIVTVTGPAKMVFIAGQTPSDENYKCVAPGDYRAQYMQVMNNLDLQLKAAGASWDEVVVRRIFAIDVDKYLAETRDLPRFYKPGTAAPNTLIGVTRLSHPDFLIEMDLIAMTEP